MEELELTSDALNNYLEFTPSRIDNINYDDSLKEYTIQSVKVNDLYVIESGNKLRQILTFKNCTFDSIVVNSDRNFQLKFINCLITEEIRSDHITNLAGLIVKNSIIKKLTFEESSPITFNIFIEKSQVKILEIKKVTSVCDVNIVGSTVDSISMNGQGKDLYIYDCEIHSIIVDTLSVVHIQNWHSKDESRLSSSFTMKSVMICNVQDSDIKCELQLTNCETLQIQNSQLNNIIGEIANITLHSSSLNNLEVSFCPRVSLDISENSSILGKIHFNSIEDLRIGNYGFTSFISKCFISNSSKLTIHFHNIDFNYIIISDSFLSPESQINLSSSNIRNLEFKNIVNRGAIRIVECTSTDLGNWPNSVGKSLSLIQSSLGHLEILQCDFSPMQEFELRGCNLSGMYLSSSRLPNQITKPNGPDRYKYSRLAYSQLKKIYESQGDQVGSSSYYSYEMKSLWKEKLKNRSWKSDPSEFIQLTFGYLFTSFGRNWLKGLLVTISFALIFHFLFLVSLNPGYTLSLSECDSEVTSELFSHFWKFINPFRSFNFESTGLQGKPGTWTSFIDFVGRIFISFGVYEIIQAFRRHGRR